MSTSKEITKRSRRKAASCHINKKELVCKIRTLDYKQNGIAFKQVRGTRTGQGATFFWIYLVVCRPDSLPQVRKALVHTPQQLQQGQ